MNKNTAGFPSVTGNPPNYAETRPRGNGHSVPLVGQMNSALNILCTINHYKGFISTLKNI